MQHQTKARGTQRFITSRMKRLSCRLYLILLFQNSKKLVEEIVLGVKQRQQPELQASNSQSQPSLNAFKCHFFVALSFWDLARPLGRLSSWLKYQPINLRTHYKLYWCCVHRQRFATIEPMECWGPVQCSRRRVSTCILAEPINPIVSSMGRLVPETSTFSAASNSSSSLEISTLNLEPWSRSTDTPWR